MRERSNAPTRAGWRRSLYRVIFEAETLGGRIFDFALLITIVLSIAVVIVESIPEVQSVYGTELRILEWVFTILFSIEYVLRLICVRSQFQYARSFYGIVDFFSAIPTYLGLFFIEAHSMILIRALRLLRIFRIFKLHRYVNQAQVLMLALRASAIKIIVFLGSVLPIVLLVGTLMYFVEGEENGFASIPSGMYWAIVTMTTVGYGDLVPITPQGKFLASLLMITGYGIIAVPTGIVSLEIANAAKMHANTRTCPSCLREGHHDDARFCRHCGGKLGRAK